jgi:uncharacterized protein YbjQ (UPF0145 family)
MAGRVEKEMVTTAFDLSGYRVVENLGVVRGIVVRSRSVVGNFVAGIQTIFGGNITMYTELCEKARGDAFKLMLEHAEDREANAVIGMRYDANEVMAGVTEVLAYGTAVRVARGVTRMTNDECPTNDQGRGIFPWSLVGHSSLVIQSQGGFAGVT